MFSTSIKSGLISILLGVLCLTHVQAQLVQTNRYELPLYSNDVNDAPKMLPLNENGALIYRRILAKVSDRIELIKLDTLLKSSWRGYINLEKTNRLSLAEVFENNAYFLIRSAVYGSFDFMVIAVDVATGQFITYRIKNIIPFTPSEFTITNQAILIGGYFNFRPVVIHFSFATGKSKLLPGFFNAPGELTQLATQPNGKIDVIVSGKNFQKRKVLWLRNYSAEGDLIQITQLEPETGRSLIFAKSINLPDETQMVAGVYGGTHPELGRGIFIAKVDTSGKYQMKYYRFTEFDNFFKFMKPRREQHIKNRIENRKEKGKITNRSYRFLIHQLIPQNDQILLVGESFYPRYIYANPYGYYGVGVAGSIVRGDRIFDGYRYTHAMLVKLTQDGTILWDNAFEINDIKTFTLEQFVKVVPLNENIELTYLYESNLRTKSISQNRVIEPKNQVPLILNNEMDAVKDKDTESSSLDYWYNKHLIAHGIQTVREIIPGKGIQERKVLFINKLRYQ